MPSTRMLIEHAALIRLIEAQRAQATIMADPKAGGWGILIRHGNAVAALAGKRGAARLFAKTDTAVAYLRSLGLLQFAIDATAFDPGQKTSPRAARPDRSVALRETHAAAAAHLARLRG